MKKDKKKKVIKQLSHFVNALIFSLLAWFNLALFGFMCIVSFKLDFENSFFWVLYFIGATTFILIIYAYDEFRKIENKK